MSIKKKAAAILSAVVAFVMALAVAVPAFAATGAGSITVTNATVGRTYSAYKIFDVDYALNEAGGITNAAYTITSGSQFLSAVQKGYSVDGETQESPFTVTPIGTTGVYNVTLKMTTNDDGTSTQTYSNAQIISWLEGMIANGDYTADATGSAYSDTYVIGGNSNLDSGYYFVTSTLGTAVTINTLAPNATVVDKNDEPTIDKVIDEGDYDSSESTASIGDTVSYKITIEAKYGAEAYVLHDTLSSGLTLDRDSFKVTAGVTTLTSGIDYTLTVKGDDPSTSDGCTFEIVFNQSYLNTIGKDGAVIVVSYDATVNENAEIGSPGNKNSATLAYSNDPNVTTVPSETKTYVYNFTLTKVDAANKTVKLSGAEFKLYESEDGTEALWFVKSEDSLTYTLCAADTEGATQTITSTDTFVTIEGLEGKPYYLEETKAPNGYNKLTERVMVDFVYVDTDEVASRALIPLSDKDLTDMVIENQAGSLLPSTGGMGTTVLYAVGAALVIGTGVTLVVRRRMNAEA